MTILNGKKSDECCETPHQNHGWDCSYRQILWVLLLLNASLFVVEVVSGFYANSQSLLADAVDFFGDTVNYGISLYALNRGLNIRAKASLIKGGTMGLFGLWVLGSTLFKVSSPDLPDVGIMSIVGTLAFLANMTSLALLYKYRNGDSNRESAWICSRNDAIGNLAVILAAIGVFSTGTKWPDLLVAAIIASLALSGAWRIIRKAREELGC